MNDRHNAMDDVRRLDPIDGDRLASAWVDSEAAKAMFQEITMTPHDTVTEHETTTVPSQAPARRRPLVLAAAATLGVASIAWGVAALSSAGSTHVACHTSADSVAITTAVSGDPVADCSALWEREVGTSAPALEAYDNGHGGIDVVAAGTEVDAGWQRLEPGVTQDTRLLALQTGLADVASGLPAQCHDADSARSLVEERLVGVGLDGWTVAVDDRTPEPDSCWVHRLDAAAQQVVVMPVAGTPAPAGTTHDEYAAELQQALGDDCMTLEAAADLARSMGDDAGYDATSLVVHSVEDEAAACASADVTVGGRVEAYVRGPAA